MNNESCEKKNYLDRLLIKQALQKKNKEYYALHKKQILATSKERTNCRLCDKNVCKGGIRIHMNSKICLNEQKIQKQMKDLGKEI